jgi:hypothetical protein
MANGAPLPLPLPSPEAIRRAAESILSRPDYQTDPSGQHGDKVAEFIGTIFRRLFGAVSDFFEALRATSPFLAALFFALLVALLTLLIGHIVYTFVTAIRVRRNAGTLGEEDELTSSQPETWEQRARHALSARNFIGAVRCLFRACLLRLELAHKRHLLRGATNREYLRRFGDTPAGPPLRLFVETIDRKWYGEEECSPRDYEQCEQAHAEISRYAACVQSVPRPELGDDQRA